MSRRKLPLESPHWWPITEALAHHSQRTSSDKFAGQDFNKVLKAKHGLRVLVRRADDHRELLAPSAWDDFHIVVWTYGGPPRSRFSVFSRTLGTAPRGCRFYVWEPDYKKFFGDRTDPMKQPAQALEVPVKRGRKPVHDLTALTVIAFALAERRKQGEPKKTEADVVRELRDWCKDRGKKVPGVSTLYEVVGIAFRIRAEWALPKK
jgi:hypothetical protein